MWCIYMMELCKAVKINNQPRIELRIGKKKKKSKLQNDSYSMKPFM